MSPEAETLVAACNTASASPAARMAGISGALRLLAAWVQSVESRLENLSHGRS